MLSMRRAALTTAVLGLLVPTVVAQAATAPRHKPKVKPVCNLVTDPAGDANGTGTGVNSPASDQDLDLLGADIATNATTLTAVVRLSALDASDSTAPGGREYQVVFTVAGTVYSVDAVLAPTGNSWDAGKGTGIVDAAHKQVHVSVPLSALGIKVTRKTVFSTIGARSYRVGGSDGLVLGKADAADSASSYTAGRPSCVKVGH